MILTFFPKNEYVKNSAYKSIVSNRRIGIAGLNFIAEIISPLKIERTLLVFPQAKHCFPVRRKNPQKGGKSERKKSIFVFKTINPMTKSNGRIIAIIFSFFLSKIPSPSFRFQILF